jgi:type II secretory pathway pseudopilin PulG
MERGPKSSEGAFSLLELLLSMSLIAVLTVAGLAAYSSVAQAAALTEAAQQVSDLLAEGRDKAIAQNTTVEVRFYDLPGSTDPAPAYRALQLHWLKADGTKPAVQSQNNCADALQLPRTIYRRSQWQIRQNRGMSPARSILTTSPAGAIPTSG